VTTADVNRHHFAWPYLPLAREWTAPRLALLVAPSDGRESSQAQLSYLRIVVPSLTLLPFNVERHLFLQHLTEQPPQAFAVEGGVAESATQAIVAYRWGA